jgi:hypothetical protein
MAINTTPTIPATLLDAVNELLRCIRMAAVMSLAATDMNEAASDAKLAIDSASLDVQMTGWTFNTVKCAVIDPTPDGQIILPSNCLKVRSARYYGYDRYVFRGGKLWDPRGRTFIIGESVKVDMVEALEFSELSAAFRKWVTARAARAFALPKLPTGSTFQYTEEYLLSAISAAELEEAEVVDAPLTYTSPHMAFMRRL